MQLLKELLSLQESPDVPVELKDIIKAFPQNHGKAIAKLWGTRRLVWHGMRFFDHDELGEAYKKAEDAVEEYMAAEDVKVDLSLELDAAKLVYDNEEDSDAPGHATIEWEAEVDFNDCQEVYLGYDPKKDKLYIGFDAWGNSDAEEAFNDAFEDAFEEATGTKFDDDNEEHQELHQEIWDQYVKMGFFGLIFEITDMHGDFSAEEAMAPMNGGFYRGTYKTFKRNHPNVIDLRLD